MGKKSWITYPEKQSQNISACGVVASVKCRLNRGMGCTCGMWSTSKICTDEEREIARRYDVRKALEEALLERKNAGLADIVQ